LNCIQRQRCPKKKKKKKINLRIKFEKWFPEIINYENLSNIDSKIYISFIDIEKFESAATGSIFIIPSEFKKKKKKKKCPKKKKKKNIDLGIKFEKWFPEIINYENLSNIDSKIYISFIDI